MIECLKNVKQIQLKIEILAKTGNSFTNGIEKVQISPLSLKTQRWINHLRIIMNSIQPIINYECQMND